MTSRWYAAARRHFTSALLTFCIAGLALGSALWLADAKPAADAIWALVAIAAGVPLAVSIIHDLLKRSAGVDVIAIIAIAGALGLGEFLTAAVIGLMLATGRALEEYAANQAERELSSLLQRAPRSASRVTQEGLETIPVESVAVGDTLLIREGDVLPVDGLVSGGAAVLDESALTGESRLVDRESGDLVRSGTANAGASFQMRATTTAADSTYAGIIRLVREAQQSKAPLVRLADRYAQVFVPLALGISGFAWLISGDPTRALSVLVVATPCPLLLAAPVAIVSGVSRAAKRGIVVKGGAAIEVLGRVEAVYMDKTGTITLGAPKLQRTVTFRSGADPAEILRLAASLDQFSSHVLAASVVAAAREQRLALAMPEGVKETAGSGIEGTVEGHRLRLGNFAWATGGLAPHASHAQFRRRVMRDEGSVIFAQIDGALAAGFVFDDPIRPDAPRVLRMLKRRGVHETVMLTGDHVAVAEAVGAAIGVDRVLAGLAPEEKVEAVRASHGIRTTLMVGDGINDAPALAAANVGVAMGARGATSSSEAADVVLVVDRLDRLVEAIDIARRSRAIAIQSMLLGMGLSFIAMGAATFGLLLPVFGALLQEGIDAAAILNALRALRPGRERQRATLPFEIAAALQQELRELTPKVESLRALADCLHSLPPEDLPPRLAEASQCVAEVLEHERRDERGVYRDIARTLDGADPLAAMHRTHQEIFHLGRTFNRMTADVLTPGDGAAPLDPEDLVDIRRTLYALHAVLRLNIAQEEELYISLQPDAHAGLAAAR